MKTFILLLSASVVLVAAGGCITRTEPKAPTNGSAKQEGPVHFETLDSRAKYSVACTGLQQAVTTDGRFKVTANLLNRENRRIEIQANCVFKDDQGFAVDQTPYRTVILDENATESVAFESFKQNVTNYTVRVREAR